MERKQVAVFNQILLNQIVIYGCPNYCIFQLFFPVKVTKMSEKDVVNGFCLVILSSSFFFFN